MITNEFSSRYTRVIRQHVLPLLLYTLLSLALTWPLVRNFTTAFLSDSQDARHHLWVLWHVKEAVLGYQPLFDLEILYYPVGASLLTHGLGPVMGFMALPFWLWGPEAAFNGAILVGFVLTGYCMYLLAWEWGTEPRIAFFVGLMLLASPIHLSGLYGHLEKTFVGLLPLGLLVAGRAWQNEGQKGWGWSIAAAVVTLLTLLHNGHQFVFLLFGLTFLFLISWFNADPSARHLIIQRTLRLAIVHLLIVGPILLLVIQARNTPGINPDVTEYSSLFQPALVEFFIPGGTSRLFGQQVRDYLLLPSQVETAVSLTWTGLILVGVALVKNPHKARQWGLFLLLLIVFALGPTFKLTPDHFLTWNDRPIPLPFALLAYLPGLDFIRTPGRFMFIGYVTFAFMAAWGLQSLMQQRPRQANLLLVLATGFFLLECWPISWPQETLLAVPPFYEQLAADDAEYGVLDLPILSLPFYEHTNFGTFYQMEQMIHRKGIAYGYISRIYEVHPLLPCLVPVTALPQDDILVNGEPSPCYEQVETTLAYYNYRYVVWHKPENWQPWGYAPGSWGEQQAASLVQAVFGDRTPFYEDEWVTVYEIDETAAAPPPAQMGIWEHWWDDEGELRWADSPSSLYILSPQEQEATLEIIPAMMFQPDSPTGYHVGNEGVLLIELNGELLAEETIHSDESTEISFTLPAGAHSLTLRLQAGSFAPADYGSPDDQRQLSFAIRSINLQMTP